MAKLIAFSGYKGSGKTTAAKELVEEREFERLRFAGPMKEMITILLERLGYDEEEVEKRVDGPMKNTVVPDLGVTTRHMLQTLGTEWGREHIAKDIWPSITLAQAQNLMAEGQDVVIDDCRFPNEAEIVRERGGRIIRIDRGLENDDSHASEAYIDDIDPDEVISNDGSISDFRKEVISLICQE